MKLKKFLSLLMALCLILCGCSLFEGDSSSESSSEPEPDPEFPVTVRGTLIPTMPERIISLSPATTELLCDMGYEDRLVGISKFCDQPESVTGLPRCGTPYLPDLESIKDLKADLVIASVALPEEDLVSLQQMDADALIIQHADSLEGVLNNYRDLPLALEGETTGKKIGEEFAAAVQERLDKLRSTLSSYVTEENRASAIYVRVLNSNLATGDTFEQEIFDLLQIDNLAKEYTDWSFPEEEISSLAPDIIFCDSSISMKMFEGNAHYRNMRAVLQDIWLPVDGSALERQSLRMLDIMDAMAMMVYPEAFAVRGESPSPGEDGGKAEPEADEDLDMEMEE